MDKKQQILEAASECFSTFGYEKTTMSDIGKQVGLNKASLYYHYKDKLALFEAMVQTKRLLHRRVLRDRLDAVSPGTPKIITFLCCEIDFIQDLAVNFLSPPSRHQGDSDDTSSVYQKIINEDVQILQELVQEGIDQGLYQENQCDDLAWKVLQTSRGLLLVDCPLDLPKKERGAGYDRVRRDITSIVTLLLQGVDR